MSALGFEPIESTERMMPAGQPFGMIHLRSGRTVLLYRQTSTEAGGGNVEALQQEAPSGAIYTEQQDMPSLEELLRQNEVAMAVLERPAPMLDSSVGGPSGATALSATARTLPASARRLVFAAVIGAAVSTVGWTLLATSLSSSVRANPYTAASLGTGGLVLLATLVVALRSRAGSGDGKR